jgi:hypothetical protein
MQDDGGETIRLRPLPSTDINGGRKIFTEVRKVRQYPGVRSLSMSCTEYSNAVLC